MFTIAASAAALIPTICFAAVTAKVCVVLHVHCSTSLRRLGSSVPAVRFAAVTADAGVGRRLPFVADVTWQIYSVQELSVLFFAMNGSLSVFGMVFVNVSHECTGCGMWIGCIWRWLSLGQPVLHPFVEFFLLAVQRFQYAAKDLATIC